MSKNTSNLVNSIDQILEILKYKNPKNYKRLKEVIDRNIPIEPYQANLLFLNRGYGKTYMSFIMMAQLIQEMPKKEILLTKEGFYDYNFDPRNYDPDIINNRLWNDWLREFKKFLEEFYPEFKISFKSVGELIIKKENK